MSEEDNGGTVFPVPKNPMGMSLRDYFAAQAIQAIIIGNEADSCALGIGAAKDAYLVADAMLEARNK